MIDSDTIAKTIMDFMSKNTQPFDLNDSSDEAIGYEMGYKDALIGLYHFLSDEEKVYTKIYTTDSPSFIAESIKNIVSTKKKLQEINIEIDELIEMMEDDE